MNRGTRIRRSGWQGKAARTMFATVLLLGTVLTSGFSAAAQSGDSYRSSADGLEWSIAWDGFWEETDSGDAADLVLVGGSSTVSFIGEELYDGNAADCVAGEFFNALDTSSVLDSAEGDAVDLGDQDGDERAYDTYDITYLDEDGDEQVSTTTILCQTLTPDESVLIVYHVVPAEAVADDADAVADLISGIVVGEEGDVPEATEEPEESAAPEAGADEDAGAYTSPSYGYTLSWEPGAWEVEADQTLNTLGRDRLTLLAEDSATRAYFEGSEEWEGDLESCVTNLIDELGVDPETSRPVERSGNVVSDVEPIDDPLTGDAFASTDNAAAAGYQYNIEFEDGSDQNQFVIVDCYLLDEDSGLILGVSQVGLVDDLGEEVRERVTNISATVTYDGEPVGLIPVVFGAGRQG